MSLKAILPPTFKGKETKKSITYVPRTYPHDILITIPSFLISDECQKWIEFMDTVHFEVINQRSTRDLAKRNHERYSFLSESIAESIFCRLRAFVPPSVDNLQPKACSTNIRLYKYGPGHSFGPHIDELNEDAEHNYISKYTVLIYLTTVQLEYGGRTIFYQDHRCKKEYAAISPESGLLLLHCHGDRCLTHEAEQLKQSYKYVLRTDVMYGH